MGCASSRDGWAPSLGIVPKVAATSRVAPEENDAESSPDEDRRVSESLTERTGSQQPARDAARPAEERPDDARPEGARPLDADAGAAVASVEAPAAGVAAWAPAAEAAESGPVINVIPPAGDDSDASIEEVGESPDQPVANLPTGQDAGSTNRFLTVFYVECVSLTRFTEELPALVCHWHFDDAHRASPRFRFSSETVHLGFVTYAALTFPDDKNPTRACSLSMTLVAGEYVAVAFLDTADLLKSNVFNKKVVELRTQVGVLALAVVHSALQPRWSYDTETKLTKVLDETDDQVQFLIQHVDWASLDASRRVSNIRISGNEEVGEIEPGKECSVCLTAPRDHAFVPCGHRCVCGGCGHLIMSRPCAACPMCRERIQGCLRIWD